MGNFLAAAYSCKPAIRLQPEGMADSLQKKGLVQPRRFTARDINEGVGCLTTVSASVVGVIFKVLVAPGNEISAEQEIVRLESSTLGFTF